MQDMVKRLGRFERERGKELKILKPSPLMDNKRMIKEKKRTD